MAGTVKPKPEGYHTITPYLVVKGAAEAIDYYKRAFGAIERVRMPGAHGQIMHAELQIGDSLLMLSDETPNMGNRSPKTLGGTTASVFLYVDDVDAVHQRALDAGGSQKMAVSDMFWGDRFGSLLDPFG